MDLKQRILKTGVKNTKLCELLGIRPSRLSEHLNDGNRLGNNLIKNLEYYLTQYESLGL